MRFMSVYWWTHVKNWLSIVEEVKTLLGDAFNTKSKELIQEVRDRVEFLLKDIDNFLEAEIENFKG